MVYALNYPIEEGSVELFAQEICIVYGMKYIPAYSKYVGALREINSLCNIGWTDLEFAKELFDIPLDDRYNWLEREAKYLLRLKNKEDRILELLGYLSELKIL